MNVTLHDMIKDYLVIFMGSIWMDPKEFVNILLEGDEPSRKGGNGATSRD